MSARPIRVGFNARLLSSPELRGWNRYTLNLLAELPPLSVTPVLYSDRPIHEGNLERLPKGSFEVRVGTVKPYAAWEQRWLPRACKQDRVDVLHAPANFGLPWSRPCPKVLTLHDAIDQVYYGPRKGFGERWSRTAVRGRFTHWLARTRADRVITVSEHARGDLLGKLGLSASKVRVTLEAADPAMLRAVTAEERAEVAERIELSRPYIFYVGGWEGRKNVGFLVDALGAAKAEGVELVLAGGRDEQRAGLQEKADMLGIGDRLRLLGWVDDADLPALYAGALAFAYPSEYEGFGLQICEAMAAGCPVFAARATCLPEVLGDGGQTFALSSTDELAGLIRRVASDPGYREELAGRARRRSGEFSWRRTAEATAAVYRELVD